MKNYRITFENDSTGRRTTRHVQAENTDAACQKMRRMIGLNYRIVSCEEVYSY